MCMQKIREAMKSIGNFPRTGIVYVDEFSVGGSEQGKQGRSYDSKKKKAICAVELTLEGKVKLFYAFKIDDYSSKSLRLMFEKHINYKWTCLIIICSKKSNHFQLKLYYIHIFLLKKINN